MGAFLGHKRQWGSNLASPQTPQWLECSQSGLLSGQFLQTRVDRYVFMLALCYAELEVTYISICWKWIPAGGMFSWSKMDVISLCQQKGNWEIFVKMQIVERYLWCHCFKVYMRKILLMFMGAWKSSWTVQSKDSPFWYKRNVKSRPFFMSSEDRLCNL